MKWKSILIAWTIEVILLSDLSASNLFYFQINLYNDRCHHLSKSLLHAFNPILLSVSLLKCLYRFLLLSGWSLNPLNWYSSLHFLTLFFFPTLIFDYLFLFHSGLDLAFSHEHATCISASVFGYIVFLPGGSCLFSFSLAKAHSLAICICSFSLFQLLLYILCSLH